MKAILRIIDQVNVKFEGLDPLVRKKIVEECKYMVPYARHMPAFKLKRWDGKISFATAGGATYMNLLDRVLPIVIDAGYEVELEDLRPEFAFRFPEVTDEFFADKSWPEGHPLAGEPIMLRDHQVDAANMYLRNPNALASLATGFGKTLLTAILSNCVEPYGRSLIIVPSKSLVEQTEEDYRNVGLDVGVFYGDRKDTDATHTIATWQSLVSLNKRKDIELNEGVAEVFDGLAAVIVDEAHGIKGQELRQLLCGALAHVPIRWGMTGTIPKEKYEFVSLQVSIGNVVGEVTAAELQEKGLLANCHIDIRQLKDDHVEFKSWDEESDFLTNDKRRLRWIAQDVIKQAESGNTLVLVDKIATGEFLRDQIPGAVFVNGSVKTKDRKKEYKEVQTADGKIIIATYGVAAVGINIPRLFNVCMYAPTKAFTRVIQTIGRGLRLAHDKDFVQIVDYTSSLKFSARHLSKRKGYYAEAGYPFALKKIDYV